MAASDLSIRLRPPALGPLVVAVSAGADSTALALLLADAKVGPLHLAHVRHGFRPDAAAQEVAALRELSLRLGAPLHVLDGAPPAAWRPGAKIPEAAARATRRRLLVELAHRLGARVVALAHHARDQVETQLLMVARGGGLRALCAMAADAGRGTVVGPMLEQSRGVARAPGTALRVGRGQRRPAAAQKRDPPPTAAALSQRGDPLLARAPALSHLAARALRRIAAVAGGAPFETRGSVREGAVVRNVASLARLSPALVHELVRAWAVERLGDAAVRTLARGRDSRELVQWLRTSRRGRRRSGDLVLERAGDSLLLHDGRIAPAPDRAVHRLEPGGSARLSGSTVEITAHVGTTAHAAPKDVAAERDGAPLAVWIPAGSNITVRARRPGDRIALTPGGSQAMSRLVNALAHPGERDSWPIVCVDDAPIWVPGARRIARPATFEPVPGSWRCRARFP
jgi:tRNA(Ile)-lysidine synthetase-like protein